MGLVIIILFASVLTVEHLYSINAQGVVCPSRETCGQCITADPDCAWCSQPRANGSALQNQPRCDRPENLLNYCNENYIVHPMPNFTMVNNLALGKSRGEVVQIKPQRVQLKLRPRETYVMKLDYQQVQDYPVDLYYLMDLSYSMRDDKASLESLGDDLAEAMKNITSNFRIGFGSFVDKVALPFVSTVPRILRDPCQNGCAPAYGFRNHMALSTNTARFIQEVKNTKISGNLDTPEGGLDALMQVVVCKKEIGWRDKSRKLVVFSTDAGFHFAGDGKLAGIVLPNDETCHLDMFGFYTESLRQDYPSISQIRRQVRDHKVNIIFAVTGNVQGIYGELSKVLDGSTVGRLDFDSKNIVKLIADQYESITDYVELKDNSTDNVMITYFSTCNDGKRENRKICRGLKVGANVSFEVHISVASCPANREDWKQTIQIYPVGINEALIIELDLNCECDCEKPGMTDPRSAMCSKGNGTFECGICNCNRGRYGRDCECSFTSQNDVQDGSQCQRPGDPLICSGRGICRCGQCLCDKRENPEEIVEGVFCELDNFSCNRVDGKICGGSGACQFGVCLCNAGYWGNECQCTNATCYGKGQDVPCSGNGACSCGVCTCWEKDGEKYGGDLCDVPLTSIDFCHERRDCFACLARDLEDQNSCEKECDSKKLKDLESGTVQACPFIAEESSCNYEFRFNAEMKNPEVSKNCPKDNALPIAVGTIAGTVLIGLLLLLLWRVMTAIHDRREYARFEKNRQDIWKTGGNPLYIGAVTEFQNPAFGQRNSRFPS